MAVVRFTSWRRGLQKVALDRAARERAEVGLAEAKGGGRRGVYSPAEREFVNSRSSHVGDTVDENILLSATA
jgi:hypothetical protein